MAIFEKDEDYAAFERILTSACARFPMRLLAYCLMPNHWHLVLWPQQDGDLSRFMRWLSLTHTQRWHHHRHSSGEGHLYQGRFKSFPVETNDSLLTVCRYVERNALRAGLVARAEAWPWSSAAQSSGVPLSAWPFERPSNWRAWINQDESGVALAEVRRSVTKNRPFGSEEWVAEVVSQWKLASTLRERGRPKKLRSVRNST